LNPDYDEIMFKDPWLIDYQDPNFANQLRNRGMDLTEWRNRTSPFNPDYNTVFQNGNDPSQTYKCVFLSQDPNFLPDLPNYSVKSPGYQDINLGGQIGIHRFYFHNWSGTDVDYENTNSDETGVVFTSSNAIANANLKGQGLSNNQNAYANNQPA
jgi:hypothetical protein